MCFLTILFFPKNCGNTKGIQSVFDRLGLLSNKLMAWTNVMIYIVTNTFIVNLYLNVNAFFLLFSTKGYY